MKNLACLFMLIDHIGAVFCPDVYFLRAAGRLAFPLFAYQTALGIRHTSDTGRYFLRLFLFALVSQLPFMLLFHTSQLNILFTFAFVVLLFHISRKTGLENVFLFIAVLAAVLGLGFRYGFEYRLYGFLSVCAFLIFEYRDRWSGALFFIAFTLLFVGDFGTGQLFSCLVVPLLLIDFKYFKFRLNKYFYYFFYPVHLAVLSWVRLCF